MARSKHYYIRKTHRYLGLILGIQFLMWTIGGLYFSWSNIDEIHGDFQKKEATLLSSDISLVSPSLALGNIKKNHPVDSVVSIQLIEVLGKPVYQIRCISAIHQRAGHLDMSMMNHLADAETGSLRGALTKEESIEIAKNHFLGNSEVTSVEYLTSTNSHHEYRESPLPAYAVSFDHPSGTVVYVSTELGTVQKFRNQKWRVFDFLWMLHTMDYQSRDNFGNTLLRSFSIFGLVTVLSGFLLLIVSSKAHRSKSGKN
jgi:uncharacterized iron-regulated membrane protein